MYCSLELARAYLGYSSGAGARGSLHDNPQGSRCCEGLKTEERTSMNRLWLHMTKPLLSQL